jgi:hypothetical protein
MTDDLPPTPPDQGGNHEAAGNDPAGEHNERPRWAILFALGLLIFFIIFTAGIVYKNSRSLPANAGESKPDKLPEKINSNLPRHYPDLEPNALERIKAKLIKSHSKTLMVFIVVGDSDKSSERLANQLYDLFWDSGFTAAYEEVSPETNVPAGLTIRVPIEFGTDMDLKGGLAQLLKENESYVQFTKMEFTTPPPVLKNGQEYELSVIIGKN